MAVSFDSAFEKGSGGQTSPFAFASNAGTVTGTVGANSNRVLIAVLALSSTGTSPAVTWNGVAMTSLGAGVTTGLGLEMFMFGLIAPATGNQTLSATWTGGAMDAMLGAISLYGADQTSPFQNYRTDTATGTAVSSTITSANGNMVVGAHVDDNATSWTQTGGTSLWDERALIGNYNAAYRASSSGSTVVSGTLGTSVNWYQIGVDVLASGGGGGSSVKRAMLMGIG